MKEIVKVLETMEGMEESEARDFILNNLNNLSGKEKDLLLEVLLTNEEISITTIIDDYYYTLSKLEQRGEI